jgi:hypothetical protein
MAYYANQVSNPILHFRHPIFHRRRSLDRKWSSLIYEYQKQRELTTLRFLSAFQTRSRNHHHLQACHTVCILYGVRSGLSPDSCAKEILILPWFETDAHRAIPHSFAFSALGHIFIIVLLLYIHTIRIFADSFQFFCLVKDFLVFRR